MRLVIAEGSAVLRAGLAHVLGDCGHKVTASVRDAAELTALAETHRPEVFIANADLPPTWTDEGLGAVLEARRRWPRTGLLVYCAATRPQHAARLFTCAADGAGVGYLLQERVTDADVLADTLTRVAAGNTVVDPWIVSTLMLGEAADSGLSALSDRELEVLELMSQGRTNSAIAQRLSVSLGTVEKRIATVFRKLGIPGAGQDNRRVLAVLRYLGTRSETAGERKLRLAPAWAGRGAACGTRPWPVRDRPGP